MSKRVNLKGCKFFSWDNRNYGTWLVRRVIDTNNRLWVCKNEDTGYSKIWRYEDIKKCEVF